MTKHLLVLRWFVKRCDVMRGRVGGPWPVSDTKVQTLSDTKPVSDTKVQTLSDTKPVSDTKLQTLSDTKQLMCRRLEIVIIIVIHSFYIALFSALEQTHCAHCHVILNEWLYPFIARIINIHGTGLLVAVCGCCMAGATWNAAVSAQVLWTSFNHAPGYSVTSFKE